MLGATQALASLDLDGVRIGPRDLGAHLLEEGDEIVDLWLLGGWADDGVALRQGRGEHRVLGAHHGHEREADLAAAYAPRGGREVVAVPVVDRGAERPHRLDMKVDRPTADPVTARVADDHPAEPRQERSEKHEARPHLG